MPLHHGGIALERASERRDRPRLVAGGVHGFGKRVMRQRIARRDRRGGGGVRDHGPGVTFLAAARGQDEVSAGDLAGLRGRRKTCLSGAPCAGNVAGGKQLPRTLDARTADHRRAAASASGCARDSASTYAASSARVWPRMSVSPECSSPAGRACFTRVMNAASLASRTAISTYSLPLFATVSVTPRLTRMVYELRSPCFLPHKVTTGTPISSASIVPLTPP